MTPYYFVFGLVASGVPLCFIDDLPFRQLAQKLYFGIVLIVLAIFAGFRGPGVDHDFGNYVFWFDLIANGAPTPAAWLRDPAFALLSYGAASLHLSFSAVTFVYALAALTATIYFSLVATSQRWATLFFFLLFCLYFTVGEMTEIRATVAQPLMAISIYLACAGQKRRALLIFGLALLFHFSVIAVLPFLVLILAGVKFRSRWWVLSLVPLAILASIEMKPLVGVFSGLYRVSEFVSGGAEEGDLPVISWYALAHLIFLAVSVFALWERLSLHQRWATLACGLGLSAFAVFGWNTGIATRFLNLFDFYWLLIMVAIVERLRGNKQFVYVAFLVFAGLALFVKSLQFVEPYAMTL